MLLSCSRIRDKGCLVLDHNRSPYVCGQVCLWKDYLCEGAEPLHGSIYSTLDLVFLGLQKRMIHTTSCHNIATGTIGGFLREDVSLPISVWPLLTFSCRDFGQPRGLAYKCLSPPTLETSGEGDIATSIIILPTTCTQTRQNQTNFSIQYIL